jgi:hypothetical protein
MQQKNTKDVLHHTYKVGPPSKPNGSAKEPITEDQHEGPNVSQPEEGKAGGGSPGVGRTPGSAKPRWVPVQVNFDVEYPLRFLKAMAKVSIWRYGWNRP